MNDASLAGITVERQRELIDGLARLIAERAQAERSARAAWEAREATAHSQFAVDRDRSTAQFQRERDALQSRYNQELADVARDYEISIEEAARDYDRRYRETVKQAEQAGEELQEDGEATREHHQSVYEDAVRETAHKLHEFKEKLSARRSELDQLEAQAARILRRRRCTKAAQALPHQSGVANIARPLDDYAEQLAAASSALEELRHQGAARFLSGGSLVVVFILTWLAVLMGGVFLNLIGSETTPAILFVVASGTVALGATAIVYVVVRPVVVRQTLEQYGRFQQSLANGQRSLDLAQSLAAAEADSRRLALKQTCERDLRKAANDLQRRREEIAEQREARLKEIADQLQSQRRAIAETRQTRQDATNVQAGNQLRQLDDTFQRQMQRLHDRREQELSAGRESFQRSSDRLRTKWFSGLDEFQSAVDAMNRSCADRFPAWESVDWSQWSPPGEELPALRFGEYVVRLDMFEHGVPDSADLLPSRNTFLLPAAISFLDRPSLLLEAWGEGRAVANRALQNAMLRLLTSLPAGKVRFTIVDPVGLGQNFSAFMHLADYDEKLVTHRIWTETAHIHQRLADLTEHMEDVIQTYLRNEFRSIAEYNRSAGEVAEPFHILVVANFPAGFSDEAAQRLLSIVSSGARCGVYSLISADGKLDLPRNFDLADLEANAATLQWNGERFCWLDNDLKDLPLSLDDLPNDERFTEIIRTSGQRAKEASRVEVPFSTVAPNPAEWWQGDSRDGIEVSLGRAGAAKLQQLRLGKGTSQHVLISGKTGSGKSTLLHVLITNTALRYAPQEVEFYLIDFKKGVEFKPYASLQLPHARVVAIESEREFGMSVLERLDVELHRRGDLFREHGVQDIKSFREEGPKRTLPRILLIIDEFQEFFVQDDRLAQEATLLLDRLVRQGRAFGIHVLLGSQTLAGAYSLARSTLGQMAIRIALQCSEADSHLILSEDNTAARLLRRPGEAIYNDANGLFEGNHPFQVVWLPAREQEDYLRRVRDLMQQRRIAVTSPIVFEGNVAADPSENTILKQLLVEPVPAGPQRGLRAWLGAAVSIKEPTAAVFHRQSGANVLLVGQQEEQALGVMANCLISLAAAPSAPPLRFVVLDGIRPDAPEAGFWRRIVRHLPVDVTLLAPQESAPALNGLAEELARRQQLGASTDVSVFLFVFNLSRFRDLRRSEEDFGFSSLGDDKPPSADKQFITLLREGPLVGLHSLVWCDTFSNATRWFDRQTLRDLDQRVLFQMSATDSSNLMDSPAASHLGVHRAILYSEERGQFEKFRPYGPPTDGWLNWVRQQLQIRGAGTACSQDDSPRPFSP